MNEQQGPENTEPLELEVRYEQADVTGAALRLVLRRSGHWAAWAVGFGVAVVINPWWPLGWEIDWSNSMTTIRFGVILLVFLMPIVGLAGVWKQACKLFAANPQLREPMRYRIDARGVSAHGRGAGEQGAWDLAESHGWHEYRRLVDLSQWYVLVLPQDRFTILPKRCFQGDAQRQAFLETARRCLGKA